MGYPLFPGLPISISRTVLGVGRQLVSAVDQLLNIVDVPAPRRYARVGDPFADVVRQRTAQTSVGDDFPGLPEVPERSGRAAFAVGKHQPSHFSESPR